MQALPSTTTDQELIAFIDRWAAFLESEDYEAAYNHTGHIEVMGWTPALMREAIKCYGEALNAQRVTLVGRSSDISQRKAIHRWPINPLNDEIGEIWYDLNIDGIASDLTATFRLVKVPEGLRVVLNDIHVM